MTETNQYIKIALITDIHNGQDYYTNKGSAALELLNDFCHFAKENDVDIVIDTGDRISDTSVEEDKKYLSQVAEVFSTLPMPKGHIIGNHDVENLSRRENVEILGESCSSQVITMNGFNIILWQATVEGFWPDGMNLSADDLNWLENALSSAHGPCIVFSHVPLDSGAMIGNYHFENNQKYSTYPQAVSARRIIDKSNKVICCIAGHVHWNTINVINNIPYICLQSLTESNTTSPEPSECWGLLEIDDQFTWTVYGRDPRQTILPIPDPMKKWNPVCGRGFVQQTDMQNHIDLGVIDGFLFDLDGVFYSGEIPLAGGKELISLLNEKNINYLAITNNSQQSSQYFSEKLGRMGIAFPQEKILTSSQALADRLTNESSSCEVFIVGSTALKSTLFERGFEQSDNPDYVVVGWTDCASISTLKEAVKYLLAGAKLIATNGDALIPNQGELEPESGALIAFLERASGKKAEIVGKPNNALFQKALNILGTNPETTLMVGDTLETDILGALHNRMPCLQICDSKTIEHQEIKATGTVQNLEELYHQLMENME